MSWYHDYLIRDAIDHISVSSGSDPRLIPLRYTQYMHSNQPGRIPFAFIPAAPASNFATTSTFEVAGVFQLYVQYTNNSTNWTAGDMLFIAGFSANDSAKGANPPAIQLYTPDAWDPSLPVADNLYAHIITKHGWKINGVSFPSVHVCMLIR